MGNRHQSSVNIDFRYQSIEIDKEKSSDFDLYLNDFPIVIDDDFYRLFSITIDSYRLLSILSIDKVFFSCDFDFYRIPKLIDINHRIKSINIDNND